MGYRTSRWRGDRGKLVERLTYELRYDKEGFSIDAALEKGRKLPEWAEDGEPFVHPSHLVFLRAFYDLGTCRPAAFDGLSPVPYDKIVLWFERSTLFYAEDFDGFLLIIRQLDAAYIKWAEDNKPKGKKSMQDRGKELKNGPRRPKRPVKKSRPR